MTALGEGDFFVLAPPDYGASFPILPVENTPGSASGRPLAPPRRVKRGANTAIANFALPLNGKAVSESSVSSKLCAP